VAPTILASAQQCYECEVWRLSGDQVFRTLQIRCIAIMTRLATPTSHTSDRSIGIPLT